MMDLAPILFWPSLLIGLAIAFLDFRTKSWGDTKRLLAEDIAVYTVILFIDIFFDGFITRLISTGIYHTDSGLHPYSFGLFQGFVAAFAIVQILRKLRDWKYYA